MMAIMVDGVVAVEADLAKEAMQVDLATGSMDAEDKVVGDEVVVVSMGMGGIMEMERITLTLNFAASWTILT